MNARTSRQETRNALMDRLENSHWNRDQLIESVTDELDVATAYVADILDDLEQYGEVYVVNEEVRRTP